MFKVHWKDDFEVGW